MLAPEHNRIAPSKARIKQNVEPYPLARSDRPARLVGGNVGLSPHGEPAALEPCWIPDTCGRVDRNVLGLECPAEQAPHGVEEIARLGGRVAPSVAALNEVLFRDPSERLGS